MVDMAKRGKRTLDLAEPRLRGRGYDTAFLYAGGLQMGPCYYYGWEPLWEPEHFQLGEVMPDPFHWFLECPTAHGEFCTGAALGVGLARTLLWGKPGSACIPDCANQQCGDDGCNGSCAECDPGYDCELGQCVAEAIDAGVVVDAAGADTRRSDATPPDVNSKDSAASDSAGSDAGVGGDTSTTDRAQTAVDSAMVDPTTPQPGFGCAAQAPRGSIGLVLLGLCALLLRRSRKTRTR